MEIYCDLDGVLVDLHKRMNEIYGYDILPIFGIKFYEYMETLNDSENQIFWSNLPQTKDCILLWNYIKKYDPFILTSCSGYKAAAIGKKIWCKNNLGIEESKVICVPHSNTKRKYSAKNKILIDDLRSNIKDWKTKGGKGILHENAEETIFQLKNLT